NAAHLLALGLADELDGDLGLDRAVEPHLLEVDVEDPAARRVELEVLEDRMVRRLRLAHDDVEDGVAAVLTGEDAPELAFGDRKRCGLLARAVEHARDHPASTQTPRFRAAVRLAGLHLELYAFSSHFRSASVPKARSAPGPSRSGNGAAGARPAARLPSRR